MRFFRPWFFLSLFYPSAIFRIRTKDRELFLTFDDGPDPDSTPVLLKFLDSHKIKGIFFCDGKNAERYPELIEKIKEGGHLVGNHGYNHLDGWLTSAKRYCEDVELASGFTSDNIFRPPFGHLYPWQFKILKKKYKVYFWDIMPYDFDSGFGSERSLKIMQKKIKPGSVIVLHDKPDNMILDILKPFVVFSLSRGYRFVLPK